MERRADIFVIIVEFRNQFQLYRSTVKRTLNINKQALNVKKNICFLVQETDIYYICNTKYFEL